MLPDLRLGRAIRGTGKDKQQHAVTFGQVIETGGKRESGVGRRRKRDHQSLMLISVFATAKGEAEEKLRVLNNTWKLGLRSVRRTLSVLAGR